MIENANELTKQVLLQASKMGARLFRRNVGMAWAGPGTKFTKAQNITVQAGDVLVRQGRPWHNGESGMFDTWGWVPVVVTAEMVGQTVPIHAEVEVKFGKDKVRPEQEKWLAFCASHGVKVGVARTVADAENILGQSS